MSLFSPPAFGGPFANITLTKDGKAFCLGHQQDLNLVYLRAGLLGTYSLSFACSMCTAPQEMNSYFTATFQTSPKNQCCVISPILSQIPSESAPIEKNPNLDIGRHVVEHELLDMNSTGYGLRSVVYMKDRGVLAACSKNGSICFWSLGGEKVELKEPKLNLEKKINFAKYYMGSNDKKYFVVGTNQGVYIYRIAGDISSIYLMGLIDNEKIVSDLDLLQEERKIVTMYNDSTAKVWSLDTLAMEKVVDLHQYDIKGGIHTVIYLKETGELAVEHEKGLSIIKDWQQKTGEVRHHLVDEKDSFGCKYLSNTRRFIMNNGSGNVQILAEADFAEEKKYMMGNPLHGGKPNFNFPKKFITSQDESLIISNSRFSCLGIYGTFDFREKYMNHYFQGIGDIEMMEDQYRIAAANEKTGIVTIYRVNANVNIDRNSEGLPVLRAVASDVKPIFRDPPTGNSGSHSRNIPPRTKDTSISKKKLTKAKPKQVSKPTKKGKKIQKAQIRSNATKKKEKEKVSRPVRKGKPRKTESLEKQEKNMIEVVRIKGKKKTKEEKVWVVLPSGDEKDEKKRGRSLEKKNKSEEKKAGKIKRKADGSEDKSRSRSKSKSVTRKK